MNENLDLPNFRIEFMFINEHGHEDYDSIIIAGIDKDDVASKFNRRVLNDIVSIQAV